VCDFIKSKIKTVNSILDVGSGELTMFSRILSRLNFAEKGCRVFASDISLSRLLVGKKSSVNLIPKNVMFKAVVADTGSLPFYTKSIELVTTDHSLEPNGARIEKVVNEVFRVAKNYCVFVEPCNNINSELGIKRMKSLGYIFDLEETIKNLGGKIIAERITSHNYNELNKSKMLIVIPPDLSRNIKSSKLDSLVGNYEFTFPGTDFNLVEKDGFLLSKESNFIFPIVDGIPILLEENRILASKFSGYDC
jgi:ubiquinone/menaquinone biosynthesis C-methylase UbiE